MEEMQARHKKEIKALDGEKRSQLKKAKQTAGKGKKAKEKLAEVETEFDTKLQELEAKHQQELAELSSGGGGGGSEETPAVSEPPPPAVTTIPPPEETKSPEDEERERKQAKARRKREKQKEKERELERQIEEENANAGPSNRQIEVQQIEQQLTPLGLKIAEIASDGNCLYRAVSASVPSVVASYQETRTLCADTLLSNEDEFAPFCEFDEKVPDFAAYVDRIRNSSDWGGHLELRVLSIALQKHILVYSMQSKEPLHLQPDNVPNDDDPIRLSYHLHYYALGEHYNQVVKVES